MRNHSLYQAGLLTVLLQDLLSPPSFRHLGGRVWTVCCVGLMGTHFTLKEDLDSLDSVVFYKEDTSWEVREGELYLGEVKGLNMIKRRCIKFSKINAN